MINTRPTLRVSKRELVQRENVSKVSMPQPDMSEEPSKKAEDKGTGGHAAVPAGVRQAERREILMRTVPGVMTSFYKVTQHSSTSFTLIFPILVLIQHVRIDQSNIFVYLENKSVKHHFHWRQC